MRTSNGVWLRDALPQTGPKRTAGGFYRTAENAARTLGGIPLDDAEDAVVAAVRMAYRVAEAQIDRSNRLAVRLRTAGERAVGANSTRQAVDGAERLVFNAALSGLSWLENIAAEGDSPIKRLLTAQYRIVGMMLGLVDSPDASAGAPKGGDARSTPSAREDEAPAPRTRSMPPIRIVHRRPRGRAVRVVAWELTSPGELPSTDVTFYPTSAPGDRGLDAQFSVDANGVATLELAVDANVPADRWRAAVCDGADVQIGWIEIEV